MAGNVLNRYLWLIRILKERGPIPFSEISKQWERDADVYNLDNKPLPLKTFHNHCTAISEFFGLEVECEKGGNYGYYLQGFAYADRWKAELLDDLIMLNLIKDNKPLSENIVNLDHKDSPLLPSIIEHIAKGHVMSFVRPATRIEDHNIPRNGKLSEIDSYKMEHGTTYRNFMPLGLFQLEYHWYCVGFFPEEKRISPFLLRDMRNITIEQDYPETEYGEFQVSEYIKGFHYDENDKFKDARPYVDRDLTLHRSRKKYGYAALPKGMKPFPW